MTWPALLVYLGLLIAPRTASPPQPVRLAVAIETSAGKAKADSAEPIGARPLAEARVGETPRIRWFVQNTDRKKPFPQSVFHFFITREERVGQELPHDAQRGSLVDNSFATELAAGDSTTGTCQIPVSEPGIYLVQFEILDQTATRGTYCGVELKIE